MPAPMLTAALRLSLTSKVWKGVTVVQRGSSEISECLDDWAKFYQSWLLVRFDKFSRGGGDWAPNSRATIENKGSSAILVDTRAMRLGLAAGGLAETKRTPTSVTISLVPGPEHPTAEMGVGELATIHHYGRGPFPARPILVPPDALLKQRMADRLKKAVVQLLKG